MSASGPNAPGSNARAPIAPESGGRHTELILVRHGVTAWNRERRFQGQIDIGLDDEGRAQAVLTGRRLAVWHIDAIYASDLSRARQTAEPIAAERGLAVRIEPRLRERHYGSFEGRTHEELERLQTEAWRRWRRREPDFALPGGGESLRVFHTRVVAALGDLARAHPGRTVVAVTHGGVLDIAYRIATGMALEAPRGHDLLNASLNRVRWDGCGFSLLAWADIAHLATSREPAHDDVEARPRRDPLESPVPRDTGATR